MAQKNTAENAFVAAEIIEEDQMHAMQHDRTTERENTLKTEAIAVNNISISVAMVIGGVMDVVSTDTRAVEVGAGDYHSDEHSDDDDNEGNSTWRTTHSPILRRARVNHQDSQGTDEAPPQRSSEVYDRKALAWAAAFGGIVVELCHVLGHLLIFPASHNNHHHFSHHL
jgi:hypothetical protein